MVSDRAMEKGREREREDFFSSDESSSLPKLALLPNEENWAALTASKNEEIYARY